MIVRPLTAGPLDFDGDARAEILVFRPSVGTWYFACRAPASAARPDSSGAPRATSCAGRLRWGSHYRRCGLPATKRLVLPEVDDKLLVKQDLSVGHDRGHPAARGLRRRRQDRHRGLPAVEWHLVHPEIEQQLHRRDGRVWGAPGDRPVPGDYDEDGKIDLGVYRPSTGRWFILLSSTNYTSWCTIQWGTTGDVLVPNDYDGDQKTDLAVYRPSNGTWYILMSSSGYSAGAGYVWGAEPTCRCPPITMEMDGRISPSIARPPATGSCCCRRRIQAARISGAVRAGMSRYRPRDRFGRRAVEAGLASTGVQSCGRRSRPRRASVRRKRPLTRETAASPRPRRLVPHRRHRRAAAPVPERRPAGRWRGRRTSHENKMMVLPSSRNRWTVAMQRCWKSASPTAKISSSRRMSGLRLARSRIRGACACRTSSS